METPKKILYPQSLTSRFNSPTVSPAFNKHSYWHRESMFLKREKKNGRPEMSHPSAMSRNEQIRFLKQLEDEKKKEELEKENRKKRNKKV